MIHEKAIGCENCHGPGSLHQDFYLANKKLAPGQEDLTIVHPGKLSRDLLEAVCASCHLSGAATVYHRGRQPTDVRPGRPLSDYRAEYRLSEGGDRMTVVGHVEQLRLSACYQKSEDLTCVTCHDPHQRETPKDLVAFRRGQCLKCHASRPCRLDEAERRKKQPQDSCVACHMPRGDTDIPHVAFTHHRIGHHAPAAKGSPSGGPTPELVPIGDVGRLSEADRERNLGLGYLHLAEDGTRPQRAEAFEERARRHLGAAHAAGLRDAATAQGLAEAYWRRDPSRAADHAKEALEAKDARQAARVKARLILADFEFKRGDYSSAIPVLQEATRERRFAEDWRLLGVSYLQQGETDRALEALRYALAIRPTRHTTHLGLAEAYRRSGDLRRSQEHAYKAEWLREQQQD
jgi:predicted CXXCH cytochrome family protein